MYGYDTKPVGDENVHYSNYIQNRIYKMVIGYTINVY